MSTLEQLIQDTKERFDRDFAELQGEFSALERDMNKTGERYGITTTDKYTRMASDSDDSAVYHIPDRGSSGDMVSPEMATGND